MNHKELEADYRDLVQVLVGRRKQLEMSQADLDFRLQCADGLVAKWEAGHKRPSVLAFLSWCHALEIRFGIVMMPPA